MRLFKRVYALQVDTVLIRDLDVDFRVNRSLKHTPNTAEITVYNLNEEHRRQIKQNKHSYVSLDVGYEGGTSRIFAGDSRKVEEAHDGTDWVTKVTAGDGEARFQAARVAASFGPDTTVELVLRTCAQALGVGLGNALDAFGGASLTSVGQAFPSGIVVHGNAMRELQYLARSCGLECSIQDGVLCVTPRGRVLSTEAIVLSPDTGLLGVPTIGKGRVVKADCLVIPGLLPGRLVEFRGTSGATGVYRVIAAEYSGESWGQDWKITLECQKYDL